MEGEREGRGGGKSRDGDHSNVIVLQVGGSLWVWPVKGYPSQEKNCGSK